MNRIYLISIVLNLSLVIKSQSQTFVHPGVLHTIPELDFVKTKILSGQQPWKKAYDNLVVSQYSQLTYVAKPYDTVKCGSFNNPNIGCDQMVDDGMAAYSLSLMWYFTNNTQYAAKAIKIINAWSLKYKENPPSYSNSRLVVSWATPWYVNAAEILRYTNSGWTSIHTADFISMLDKFQPYVLDETMPSNNWIQSAIEARISIAIFKNDKISFDAAVSRWKQRVKIYLYETIDGSSPTVIPGKTVSQTVNIWKNGTNNLAFVNGLAMETCRDLGHLKLGFNSMMYAAESAWHQGVDLFSLEKKRLSDFLELHGGWMTGSKAVPLNICDGVVKTGLSSTSGISPPAGGGRIAWEIAYNHLHDRLGMNLPYTLQMINSSRPTNIGEWVFKWETLMYAGRQFGSLPIELIEFTGEKSGHDVILSWTTSKEENNHYFLIEHSEDGINFSQIGKLSGKGNSNNVTNYSYTDYSMTNNIMYYRLIQVDNDSTSNISKIICVNDDPEFKVKAFPNPSNTDFTLTVSSNDKLHIEVINLNGEIIDSFSTGSAGLFSFGGNYPIGIYFLKAVKKDGIKILKIIKY